MARQVRIEYVGAFYHVMARGNRRNLIFVSLDGADEDPFLGTLGECCERTGFSSWAWVLMGNHYHLLVETPAAKTHFDCIHLNPVRAGLVPSEAILDRREVVHAERRQRVGASAEVREKARKRASQGDPEVQTDD